MKHLRKELWFNTPHRRDYINITPQIESLVTDSGVQNGLCLVNAMHITASVYINDNESGLIEDYDEWLEKLAPHAPTEVSPQPHRRRQRRRAHEAPAHGPRGRGRDHRWQAGLWAVGANL